MQWVDVGFLGSHSLPQVKQSKKHRATYFRCLLLLPLSLSLSFSLSPLSFSLSLSQRRPQRRRVEGGEEITANELAQGRGGGHLHTGHYGGGQPREQIRYNVLRSSVPDVREGNAMKKQDLHVAVCTIYQNLLI